MAITRIDQIAGPVTIVAPRIPDSFKGPKGDTGAGVASGGASNDLFIKQSAANFDTGWASAQTLGLARVGANENVTGIWAFSGGPVYSALQTYSAFAVLSDGARFLIAGRTSAGDNGGGLFRWRAGSQFSTLAMASTQVAAIDTATDVLTLTGHTFRTGDVAVPNATANGLTVNIKYYVRRLSANTLALYTTWADSKADTNRVDITGTLGSLFLRRHADPAQGVYVTLNGDPLGLNGAFERVLEGDPNVGMFGAAGNDSADDAEPIQHGDVWAQAFGSRLIFDGKIYRISTPVEKSSQTAWEGPGPNRSSGARGAMITSDFNGDVVTVRGDGVNRRGSVTGIRFLNTDRATFTSARGIVMTDDARDQLVTSCYIGNYDEGIVCDSGKAIYIDRCYSFGAITNGIRLQDVTDCWIIETQADGDVNGIYLLRAGACQVNNSRPQGSDGTNMRVEDSGFFVMDGGFCDSAVLATSGTPGPALEIINCTNWRINGVTFYANHASQPQIFIDATAAKLNTDGLIDGCVMSVGSSSNVIGIEFGAIAGTCRGITINGNTLRACNTGIVFNSITGTLDTIYINGSNTFPATAITGANNVQSGLYVEAGPGRPGQAVVNSPSADLVINSDSPELLRIGGSVSSNINVDLPATGNYSGKKFTIRRDAVGAGLVAVRHGTTVIATLRANNDWVEAVATGTTAVYAVAKRSFSGGTLGSDIDFSNNDAGRVRTLSFFDTGEPVAVSSNQITVTRSTVTLNEAAAQTINTINTSFVAAGVPWFRIRQVGAGAVTFTHSSNLRLPYGRSITLNQNESLLFEVLAANTVQLVGKVATDYRDLSNFSGSVVVSDAGAQTLFNAGVNGAVWDVTVMNTGGVIGARAMIVGSATAPQVEDLNSGLGTGAVVTTISVSGTDITVTSDSATARTCAWRAYRLV